MSYFSERFDGSLNKMIRVKTIEHDSNESIANRINDASWHRELLKLCTRFRRLPSQEAQALVPEIEAIIAQKQAEIHELTQDSPEKEDELLDELFWVREQLELDERERKRHNNRYR